MADIAMAPPMSVYSQQCGQGLNGWIRASSTVTVNVTAGERLIDCRLLKCGVTSTDQTKWSVRTELGCLLRDKAT